MWLHLVCGALVAAVIGLLLVAWSAPGSSDVHRNGITLAGILAIPASSFLLASWTLATSHRMWPYAQALPWALLGVVIYAARHLGML